MPSPNDIKKGTVVNYEGQLWVVVDFQRVSPGKGSSFVRTKMKSIKTGKVNEYNLKSSENLVFEEVQNKKMQYLFSDGTYYTFMDMVSFEQIQVSADMIGDDAKYLKEGLEVSIVMHDGNALTMQLPRKIQYTVTYSEPAVKGDTASGNVLKDVELDNGLVAKAPAFIKQGDEIMVNSENGEYAERVSR